MALLIFWTAISMIVAGISWASLSFYDSYSDRDGSKRKVTKKIAHISSGVFLVLGSLIALIASF